jgi:hypothetical protein
MANVVKIDHGASGVCHVSFSDAEFITAVKKASIETLAAGAYIMASHIRGRLAPHNKTGETFAGITGRKDKDGGILDVGFPGFQSSFGHMTRGKEGRSHILNVLEGRGTHFVKPIGGARGFIVEGALESYEAIGDLFIKNMPGKMI